MFLKMSNCSFKTQIIVRTTPGDDWSRSDDGTPRCNRWRNETLCSIPPAPSPTNLPVISSDINLNEILRAYAITNSLHSLAWAWCSRLLGIAWWHSVETLLTSSGVDVWRIGKPQRKSVPSGSCRSRKLSSAGLCSNWFQTHGYAHGMTFLVKCLLSAQALSKRS